MSVLRTEITVDSYAPTSLDHTHVTAVLATDLLLMELHAMVP